MYKAIGINSIGHDGRYAAVIQCSAARYEDPKRDPTRVSLYLDGAFVAHVYVDRMEPDDDLTELLAQVDAPAPHDACGDQGLQVSQAALAELGPVGASIEAAEEAHARSLLVPITELNAKFGSPHYCGGTPVLPPTNEEE